MGFLLIVGQAPNKEIWKRATARGRRGAERRSARLALSGRCGRKLAELLGVELEVFLARTRRVNLNDRWHGKDGKGDAFDEVAGVKKAQAIWRSRGGPKRVVLLGHVVAECFGMVGDFLEVHWTFDDRRWLIFPHPSGVNRWWNDPKNRRRARAALRQFAGEL